MEKLQVNIDNILGFVTKEEIESYHNDIYMYQIAMQNKQGAGSDFLGWMNLSNIINEDLIKDIEDKATEIRKKSDLFVVIGIGGSYLGAKAVIEALNSNFEHLDNNKKDPLIIYAGQNICEDYLSELLDILDKKDYSLAVISKSGTTTEPALAFRILKDHMEKKYGKEDSKDRIIAITDKTDGALKELSNNEDYKTYIIPDDVGGRYSVLTPVGLLPIAVAGYNIRELISGAKILESRCNTSSSVKINPAALYAASRNALYKKGKQIELKVIYNQKLYYLTEWWKQLYGESEGKENKGIFPSNLIFTTDLHSMGQYIQEGLRNIFETVLSVEKPMRELKIPTNNKNLDKLNYLAGKNLDEVNKMAELGTMLAHVEGGVPNIKISIPRINENYIGQLIYFYEMACALSGYILGVNPFNQPGVEAYKKNMFALLGKPGFESETKMIINKMK